MAGDKSEKPTAERLRKAREDGQFLSSRGMLTAIEFTVFAWVISIVAPELSIRLQAGMGRLLKAAFETRAEITSQKWMTLLRVALLDSSWPLLSLGAVLFGSMLALQLVMTRLGFSFGRLTPKLGNLNPTSKLSALPPQNIKAAGEAIFIIGVLALAISTSYQIETDLYMKIPFQSLRLTASQVGQSVHKVLWHACAVFISLGSVDFAVQYRRYMSQLKMSKQEIREEHRRSEGDPQTKIRIRRLRRDLLRHQMMKQVPKATAVIANPTHFAVAIRYDMESMMSPVVVAKGKNWLALRIRQVAVRNEVPVIENPPLARALYDAAEVGGAISPQFYKAVAEILAYVYKIMGHKLPS